MDHAEARALLMELALEPARLRDFDHDLGPGSSELRAHLATCADCGAELRAWQATVAALDLTASAAPSDEEVPARSILRAADPAGIALPAGLRARTLAAARERTSSPALRVAASRRAMRPPAWLAIAAAVVLLLGGAVLVVDRTRQLDQARADTAALATVTNSLDRILEDPGHQVALLRTPAGVSAGSVSWSSSEGSVVVLAGALQSPPPGDVYRCWIGQGGASVPVGEMSFSGSMAYWAGSLDSWSVTVASGDRFWVSLEPSGGGSGGTQVLVGTL